MGNDGIICGTFDGKWVLYMVSKNKKDIEEIKQNYARHHLGAETKTENKYYHIHSFDINKGLVKILSDGTCATICPLTDYHVEKGHSFWVKAKNKILS